MMEFLTFTFQSFWHWAGVTFIIAVVVTGVRGMFARKEKDE